MSRLEKDVHATGEALEPVTEGDKAFKDGDMGGSSGDLASRIEPNWVTVLGDMPASLHMGVMIKWLLNSESDV